MFSSAESCTDLMLKDQLLEAVRLGDLTQIKILISEGADINAVYKHDLGPLGEPISLMNNITKYLNILHIAVAYRHVAVVQFFMEQYPFLIKQIFPNYNAFDLEKGPFNCQSNIGYGYGYDDFENRRSEYHSY